MFLNTRLLKVLFASVAAFGVLQSAQAIKLSIQPDCSNPKITLTATSDDNLIIESACPGYSLNFVGVDTKQVQTVLTDIVSNSGTPTVTFESVSGNGGTSGFGAAFVAEAKSSGIATNVVVDVVEAKGGGTVTTTTSPTSSTSPTSGS